MRKSHVRALRAFEQRIRARNLSPRTRQLYLGTARRLLATLEKPLSQVKASDVRAYLAGRVAVLGGAQHAAEHYHLRALFCAVFESGLLASDPMDQVAVPRVRRACGLVLSETAVEQLLLAASAAPWQPGALRDRALVELAYGLGIRRAELAAARLVDLDLAAMILRVRRAKRGQDRLLPLPPAALPHLRSYVEHGRPALLTRRRDQGILLLNDQGGPLRPNRISEAVRRIARQGGIRATTHALRRSIATHLARAGASVVAVQELLGHERLDTTAIYVAVDRDDLRRAVAVLECGLGR